MIINKEVEGVELETVAVGSIPESPMFKWIEVDEEYLFSYSQNDTFLIRHYSAADEGGTFWIEVKEVCLQEGQPFFYDDKSYMGMAQGTWKETRTYIDNSFVIKKLIKNTIVWWNDVNKHNFYEFQLNNIPNKEVNISESDYESVINFLESSQDDIEFLIKED